MEIGRMGAIAKGLWGSARDSSLGMTSSIRRIKMATYIVLINYTQQGIKNIKESPARFDAAKKALQPMGADLKQVFLTMGQYDLVIIAEAPDDETIAKFLLATGSLGNVSTQTMRAFTEDEFRKIVAGLP
jgi:uncharacterized protein with GYD domain